MHKSMESIHRERLGQLQGNLKTHVNYRNEEFLQENETMLIMIEDLRLE
jgi:hypothetical protein